MYLLTYLLTPTPKPKPLWIYDTYATDDTHEHTYHFFLILRSALIITNVRQCAPKMLRRPHLASDPMRHVLNRALKNVGSPALGFGPFAAQIKKYESPALGFGPYAARPQSCPRQQRQPLSRTEIGICCGPNGEQTIPDRRRSNASRHSRGNHNYHRTRPQSTRFGKVGPSCSCT